MTVVFAAGMLTIGLLLGLLTLISTLIGQRLPMILAAIEAGVTESGRGAEVLRYAA